MKKIDYVKVRGIASLILLFLLLVITSLYPWQSVQNEFQKLYFFGVIFLMIVLGYFILMYLFKSTTPELYEKFKK